jgi:mannosyltransferase
LAIRSAWPLVVLITLGALVPRLLRLDRLGLWYDEGFSVLMIELADPAVWRLDEHPPLYYGLLWAWSALFSGDAWLRSLSALFGAATIPIVFAIGARLFSAAAGVWGAILLSLLHIHVWYSREARMYALMVFLFAVAVLGLVKAIRRERGGWFLYAVALALLTLSHALGIVHAVLLTGLYWILAPPPLRAETWRAWACASTAALLPFFLWLPLYLTRVAEVTAGFWIRLRSPWPPLLDTLRAFLGVGPDGWFWVSPLVVILGAVAIGHSRASRRAVVALFVAYAAPMVALTIVSLLVKPVLISRVLLPAVVPLVLLLGSVVDVFPPRRRWHDAALVALAGVLVFGAFHGWRNVVGPHHEWREASAYLQRQAGSADTVFMFIGRPRSGEGERARLDLAARAGYLLLRRYDPDRRLAGLRHVTLRQVVRGCPEEAGPCLDKWLGALPPGSAVWLVRAFDAPHASVHRWVADRLAVPDRREFKGLVVERRVLRPPT